MANYAIYVAPPPPEIEDDGPTGDAIRAKLGAGIAASKGREFNTLGTVLGLGCANSPIVAGDGTPAAPHDSQIYRPTAHPGYLAPHAWLEGGASLYDLFGPGFTLIADDNAPQAEIDKAVTDARELGIPLSVVRPHGVPVAELYGALLALVRPDQHVAWRGNVWRLYLSRATGWAQSAVMA